MAGSQLRQRGLRGLESSKERKQEGGEESAGAPLPEFFGDSAERLSGGISSCKVVAMMQTAESSHRHDPASSTGIFFRDVRPVGVPLASPRCVRSSW